MSVGNEEGSILSPELEAAIRVNETLIKRFGNYKESEWIPTQDNIIVQSDEEYNNWLSKKFSENNDLSEDQAIIMAENSIAYADFNDKTIHVRKSQVGGQKFDQTLAHEELHLWFLRNQLDDDNPYSYGVNETLIETLALEGLDLFTIDRSQREPEIDNAINNSIIIKKIIDDTGEEGWKGIFTACQSGNQEQIERIMNEKFGIVPPSFDLRQINDKLPVLFGKDFWGRFKETSLMIYLIRQDPEFQINNPAVDYQLLLMTEWSKIDKSFMQELDIHS